MNQMCYEFVAVYNEYTRSSKQITSGSHYRSAPRVVDSLALSATCVLASLVECLPLLDINIYIYIYIEREREKERERYDTSVLSLYH